MVNMEQLNFHLHLSLLMGIVVFFIKQLINSGGRRGLDVPLQALQTRSAKT